MTQILQPVDPPQFKAPTADTWRNLGADAQADKVKQDVAKVARDTLNETLLTSLQMQHVMVLAGSGASMAVGGPSMNNLWEAAIGIPPIAAAISTATTINYDLTSHNNIEEFLSKAEAYLQVRNNDLAVKKFVDSCKEAILAKCSSFLDVNKLEAHTIFLHRLSRRRVRDPRLKIFTTNYDLCFEQAASTLGGVIIDGFSFTPPRHYDPRYFSYDIIRRPRAGEDQGNYLEGVFHLYKLHGSVNWARSANGVIHEKSNPSPDETCLIYPARGKYQQSFLQPHLESMSQYLAALREPNTCVIVTGFGLNDDHLSEPLLAAVRSNPHLRLIITGPGVVAREIDKARSNRYWEEFFKLNKDGEDVWLINASFQEFAKLIPDLKSLTPADKLMNTIKDIAGSK